MPKTKTHTEDEYKKLLLERQKLEEAVRRYQADINTLSNQLKIQDAYIQGYRDGYKEGIFAVINWSKENKL